MIVEGFRYGVNIRGPEIISDILDNLLNAVIGRFFSAGYRVFPACHIGSGQLQTEELKAVFHGFLALGFLDNTLGDNIVQKREGILSAVDISLKKYMCIFCLPVKAAGKEVKHNIISGRDQGNGVGEHLFVDQNIKNNGVIVYLG